MLELKSAAKKAAKKTAAKKSPAKKSAAKKSAAKKSAAKKSADHGKPGKDMRRAYEHLGRVQTLASVTGVDTAGAKTLASYAEQSLRAGEMKDAAELLRAAEHHLFGSMAMTQPADESLSSGLLDAVRETYENKAEKAGEHGACADAPPAIRTIYQGMLANAAAALEGKQFRAALELARGAEALTHATFAKLLPDSAAGKPKRIKADA